MPFGSCGIDAKDYITAQPNGLGNIVPCLSLVRRINRILKIQDDRVGTRGRRFDKPFGPGRRHEKRQNPALMSHQIGSQLISSPEVVSG